MNRKLLIFCFVLIAITAIGVVAANPVTFEGMEFNIPDGYNYNQFMTDGNLGEDNATGGIYTNGDDEEIWIVIYNNTENKTLDDLKDEDYKIMTINGKEGGFQNGIFVTFTYPEGDKLVSIFAPDEDTVGKIVGS